MTVILPCRIVMIKAFAVKTKQGCVIGLKNCHGKGDSMKDDTISRQAAIAEVMCLCEECPVELYIGPCPSQQCDVRIMREALENLPSAQPDAVTASLEELLNDYGEDGFFIVDGVNYQANELLNELKTNSSVGEKFRKQITKTIVQYFMKFGG